MSTGLERRVDRLEESAGAGDKPHRCVVLTVEQADAPQAIEKHLAAHPETPEYTTFVLEVIVDHIPERGP